MSFRNLAQPFLHRRNRFICIGSAVFCLTAATAGAADSDSDTLDDSWEMQHFGNLDQDAAGDPDGDGVSNAIEQQEQLDPTVPDYGVEGYLSAERWDSVNEATLAAALGGEVFRTSSPLKGLVAQAEAAQNAGDRFLVRWRGTLVAPETGDYRFFIASDFQSQLWLGEAGGSKFTRRKVGELSGGPVASRAWHVNPTQDSGLIHLQAGESYYVEVLMLETTGLDSLAVGWQRPGQSTVEVIPGKLTDGTVVLKSYVPDPLDSEDDGLLDSWELAVGLNMGDGGAINAADGAYADWDNDGLTNYEEWRTSGDPLAKGGNTGVFQRDLWIVPGLNVANLTGSTAFPRAPLIRDNIAGPLKMGSVGDGYGQRLKGLVVAPVSGDYRFWVAGDDSAEFWLSTDASRLHKRKLAYAATATAVDAFDTTPSQKSVAVPLEAGQAYYFEVLHKENGGADHVSVAWGLDTPNWALAANGAVATQSSTGGNYVASKAIDGNTNGHIANCTQTTNTANSWWQVDFGQDRQFNRVTLFSRAEVPERLSNFRISVLDASGNEVIGQNFFEGAGSVGAGVSFAWDLPQAATGRKVKIQLLGHNNYGDGYLTLAEVQVQDWLGPMSARQIVAAEHLRTEGEEPLDDDADSLPDAWEQQYGLSNIDGGAIHVSQGEYGDPDGDGVPNLLEYINGSSPVVPNGEPGKLQRDTWVNLPGGNLYDLVHAHEFLKPAHTRDAVTAWQTSDRGDYYGQRLRGLLTAPTTGWYTFWIAGTENQLLLSGNDRKFYKVPIAEVGGNHAFGIEAGTTAHEWDKYPGQRSKPVYLTEGSSYFLEALQKEDSGRDLLNVAWQVPGGVREQLPFSALRSFTYDIDDDDDDDLPNSWESQHGLDPADNGRYRRGYEGARGDADGDQLTNHEEFLLGTDPLDADSDGDGLSDYIEVHSLGSDPDDANSGTGTALADLQGSQGASESGNWITGPNNTLLSLDRRGTASWEFTLGAPGAKLLEALATPQGNTWAGNPLTIEISIVRPSDSKRWLVGSFPLRDDEGEATRVLALMPWLPAGSYKAEITIRNLSESRNVRIDRLRILDPSGADANGNGVADWVEARLGSENGLLTTGGESPVSPACLEGVARDLSSVSLVVDGQPLAPVAGIDSRWFADIALPADGTALPLVATFENGNMEQPHALAWVPTNILDGGSLTVRTGDSLRLTAFPGASPDSGTVTITGLKQTINTTADAPAVHTFVRANWALAANGAVATQSSTYGDRVASWAIDGNMSGAFNLWTHTQNSANSWWQVDLGQDRDLKRVTLFNRTDVVWSQARLSNFRISVLDASNNEVIGQNFFEESGHAGEAFTWDLPQTVTGRKVKIQILGYNHVGDGYLTLAEVQVFPPDQYTLSATHTDGNGAVTAGDLVVNVVSPDFGPALMARTDRWRDWATQVPATLPLEFDASIQAAELTPIAGYYNLKVATRSDKPVNVIARSEVAGSVAAKGTVDPYLIGDPYDTGYVELLDTLPDGTIHGRISVVADRLPPGGYVEIQIWAGGTQFADGTTVKRLYASDFGPNGVAYVDVYYPTQAAISSFCAYYRLRDANGTLLSGY